MMRGVGINFTLFYERNMGMMLHACTAKGFFVLQLWARVQVSNCIAFGYLHAYGRITTHKRVRTHCIYM